MKKATKKLANKPPKMTISRLLHGIVDGVIVANDRLQQLDCKLLQLAESIGRELASSNAKIFKVEQEINVAVRKMQDDCNRITGSVDRNGSILKQQLNDALHVFNAALDAAKKVAGIPALTCCVCGYENNDPMTLRAHMRECKKLRNTAADLYGN